MSKVFMMMPNKCDTGNKTEILKINICIINDNPDVITSTLKEKHRHDIVHDNVKFHKLNNCIMYEREYDKFKSTYIDYNFEISLDLISTEIIQYLMEIEAQTIRTNNHIEFASTIRKVGGCKIHHDVKHRTLILRLDYDSRNSSPTHKSEETVNIDMISKCILHHKLFYIKNIVEVTTKAYYYNNDDDDDDNMKHHNKYPRYTKPNIMLNHHKQLITNIHNTDTIHFIDYLIL